MAEEKILKDELLSDDELDNVAGGTYVDSLNVSNFLDKVGFKNVLNDGGLVNFSGMRDALSSIGISSHDHGGVAIFGAKGNTYTVNATGEKLDQAGMMAFLRQKYPNVQYNEIVESK